MSWQASVPSLALALYHPCFSQSWMHFSFCWWTLTTNLVSMAVNPYCTHTRVHTNLGTAIEDIHGAY